MTPADIRAALTPEQAVLATLWGEVRDQHAIGILAVALVIRNRVLHPTWWGHDWKNVCLTPWQFSCWWATGANYDATYAFAAQLIDGVPPPDAEIAAVLRFVAQALLGGTTLTDFTGGATHYCTLATWHAPIPPKDFAGQTPLGTWGAQVFFRIT